MRLNTRFAVVAERCSFGCFRNLARPRAEGWSCLCLGVRILPSAWASCTNAGMRTRMIAHGGCEKMLCCAHGAARITQTSVIRNRDAACACCALRSGICGNDGGLVFVLSPMLASSDSGLASSRNHIRAQMRVAGCIRFSCHYALGAAPPNHFRVHSKIAHALIQIRVRRQVRGRFCVLCHVIEKQMHNSARTHLVAMWFRTYACVFLFVLDTPGASTRCLGLQIHALHYSFDLQGSCVTICPPLTCYR